VSAPLLEAAGLTKVFGSTTAADDVSFEVCPGEVVGLLGANGAGKTTVIRMLLGLLRPTSGRAQLLGTSPSLTTRRELGYVPQGLGLYQELTVAENLAFSAQAYGAEPAELTGTLADAADRQLNGLPLGLQRQLAFLCALAHTPRVLVLDEPTSGVDPLARARLWNTVREQADRGVAVLVTTHYMQEARQCDRLLLMSRGLVVGRGSEADIVGDTAVVLVETSAWEQAFSALDAAGLPVTLAGTAVRVVGATPEHVALVLQDAGVDGRPRPVTATIDERMVLLATAHTAP
jgi:ABC-2 type transport system ATP-binding protein